MKIIDTRRVMNVPFSQIEKGGLFYYAGAPLMRVSSCSVNDENMNAVDLEYGELYYVMFAANVLPLTGELTVS